MKHLWPMNSTHSMAHARKFFRLGLAMRTLRYPIKSAPLWGLFQGRPLSMGADSCRCHSDTLKATCYGSVVPSHTSEIGAHSSHDVRTFASLLCSAYSSLSRSSYPQNITLASQVKHLSLSSSVAQKPSPLKERVPLLGKPTKRRNQADTSTTSTRTAP